MMGSYKLSLEAKEDLRRIYRYGIESWDVEQADKYYNTLFDRFEKIARNPHLYQSVDNIRKGYRYSVCGVDTIYFRIEDGVVQIMNIIGSQDF
ncbi:MAG: type II toxin-antitoxin system RelE/ParE family toxin [Gammaproteobacteria bacterium]